MRYKATVSYDGSNYFGWQSQSDVVNIQDTIEEALKSIHKREVRITGSGRTDRGVHAVGQVFHFDSDLNISEESWVRAINANLPGDIHILKVEQVSDDFHARFDVVRKRYDYYLNTGEYDVFSRDHILQFGQPLNIERMQEAKEILIGRHDFSSFSANSFEETPDQVRNLEVLEIEENENIIHFIFIGDGFMRYMVRMIVGALIEIGRNRMDKDELKEILNSRNKNARRCKAGAEGLYLSEVVYYQEEEE